MNLNKTILSILCFFVFVGSVIGIAYFGAIERDKYEYNKAYIYGKESFYFNDEFLRKLPIEVARTNSKNMEAYSQGWIRKLRELCFGGNLEEYYFLGKRIYYDTSIKWPKDYLAGRAAYEGYKEEFCREFP